MNFEDFQIERIVFEVRYKNGYLYWDNFGKLWKGLAAEWPEIEVHHVDTQTGILKLKEKFIDINVNPQKSFIIQHLPKKLDDFNSIAENLVGLLNELLEIETFTRVGNRFILILPCDSVDEATNIIKEADLFSVNTEKTKSLGKILKENELRLLYHSDDVGTNFRLQSVDRKLTEFPLPTPSKIDTSWFIPKGVLLDIDYFSIKPVGFGILKSTEYINNNFRKLKRFVRSL